MAWVQVLEFYPSNMGTKKGWCEQNAREGFGIPNGTFPSAKADMESQRKNGTLHNELPPSNVAVPVFINSTSKYEHVEVCDHGTYWSDGKKVGKPNNTFGWGELMDGVRVVKWVDDPKPEGFLPPKGYWCRYDKDARVAELASFMRKTFPAYTPVKALGPVYGNNLWKSILEFQKRCGMSKKDCDGNTGPITYKNLKKYGFKG